MWCCTLSTSTISRAPGQGRSATTWCPSTAMGWLTRGDGRRLLAARCTAGAAQPIDLVAAHPAGQRLASGDEAVLAERDQAQLLRDDCHGRHARRACSCTRQSSTGRAGELPRPSATSGEGAFPPATERCRNLGHRPRPVVAPKHPPVVGSLPARPSLPGVLRYRGLGTVAVAGQRKGPSRRPARPAEIPSPRASRGQTHPRRHGDLMTGAAAGPPSGRHAGRRGRGSRRASVTRWPRPVERRRAGPPGTAQRPG